MSFISVSEILMNKWQLLLSGFKRIETPRPKSSQVLEAYLKQRNCTAWTAFYVAQKDVENDLWGQSHFNFQVSKDCNYHVLRTGAYPFIKFHCTLRPRGQDLTVENHFYNFLKVINFGFPTLLYGLAGLLWANHRETVSIHGFEKPITLYFWYKETHDVGS